MFTKDNGFLANAAYDSSNLNGKDGDITFQGSDVFENFTVDGTNFKYTGSDADPFPATRNRFEKLQIDNVTEDLVIMVIGQGRFTINARVRTH